MRSIILEVRQAVVDGIALALADEAVSVTYGWQGGSDDARREQVFTNNARATHQSSAMRPNRNYRNEDAEFEIVVLVVGPAQRPEEADQRAMDIGQVVEEFIADHKSNELDIDGLNWLEMGGFELSNRISTSGGATGSISELTYTVRYNARLT